VSRKIQPPLLRRSLLVGTVAVICGGAALQRTHLVHAQTAATATSGITPRLLEAAPLATGNNAFNNEWKPEQDWMRGNFDLMTENDTRFIRVTKSPNIIRRTFPLSASDKALVLAAKVRMKGFAQGKNPWDIMLLAVNFLNAEGKSMANPWGTSLKFNKDQDWKDESLVVPIPAGAKQVQLEVLHKGAEGTFDVANLRFAAVPTVPTAAQAGAIAAAAQFPPPPPPYKVDVSKVTGAKVDEKLVQRVLEVGRNKTYKTFGAAWQVAMQNIKDGVPTKVLVHPGIYREGNFELNAQKIGGKSADTLLVIEAARPGTAILSGSDVFAPNTWRPVKDATGKVVLYEHDWPHDFGFRPGGWLRHNPKLTIEHRQELAFINGQPLKQVELEIYKHTPVQPVPNDGWNSAKFPEGTKTDAFKGVPQDINNKGLYEYQRFLDPATTLKPGTFGVAERDENGNKIFLRPAEGTDWNKALVEVGVRPFHIWSFYKHNLVLRGLTFQHGIGEIEARGAVLIGNWWPLTNTFDNNNIVIEDCDWRWNNNNQLVIRNSRDLTLRRNKLMYGAYGGILTGVAHNVLLEDNETSFNNWRVGGGWASGPVKIHETVDAIFRRHTSVGNFGTGLWYDITCANTLVEDATLLNNSSGFDWEISQGVEVRRALIANNTGASMWIPTAMDMVFEDSIIYGGKGWGQFSFEAGLRDSGQKINEMLGRPVVEKYQLGPLTLRNSVVVSSDATPLFFQGHGNPTFYSEFLKGRVTSADNLWFAPTPKAFGFGRNYGEGWQSRPVSNHMGDFKQWQETTGDTTSRWADPKFVDPANFDFRLQPDSPLKGRPNLPTRKVDAARVKQLRDFMALGLHVKENAQDVAHIAE
jgi:hypothetical protein